MSESINTLKRVPADRRRRRNIVHLAIAAIIIIGGILAKEQFVWVAKFPRQWVIPLKNWITDFFEWIVYGVKFFEGSRYEFVPTDITRGMIKIFEYQLSFTDGLFFNGFRIGVEPLPWITVVGLMAILGHWVAGPRMALIAGGSFLYLSLFSVWRPAMDTFSLVLLTVPFVFSIGLMLAIWMSKSARVERTVTPVFDLMQAMPPFAYMVPIVVLFGIGDVPAMLAVSVFAVPPVARCILLGLQTVPHEVLEAGEMAGCTSRQMLWKVKVPTSRSTVLVGLNQGIMQTLAMIVLASLIGASGLGNELLNSLQTLRLGQALEQGLAIVVIAVALDRLSAAYAHKPKKYIDKNLPWMQKHSHLMIAVAFLIASIAVAWIFPALRVLPKEWPLTTAPMWDAGIDWVLVNWYDNVQGFRNFVLIDILIPIKKFMLSIPWPTFIGLLILLGYRMGGWKLALTVGLMISFPLLMGLWKQTMITVYMIGSAAIICIVVGFPIGLLAARSERLSRYIILMCDFFQTFPSFIYLIPVIMLFKVSDISAIIAVLAFALVPMVRYTNLGFRNVPFNIREAAIQQGASRWQRLTKVELPLAAPEIMLGINQVIFMALFMVAITALIGTQDLGSEINRARTGNKTGRALVAGLCIAFLGMIADRLIKAWRKQHNYQNNR
ncbi:MAG: glycine betaine/proline transport system permease protein [Granulosicoccus sp.]|jgi:glycine betaine/proline transport system permease protein